nr:ribonuclease H-like domain-containing protein [Tanacetum cinerariifolium]
MSISIYGRPKETGIKYFLSGEIGTMMASGGSFMTSFEDINSFLAMHTPANDLICINPKQIRVIPKVMFNIFEEFLLLLECQPFLDKIPRMEICYVGKPWVVQTPGSGISNLLAVGTPFTGSGNLYCQWELSPGNSLGKFDGKVDEGFLVGFYNTNGDAAFDEKEPEFEGRKPESEVNVSPSSKFKDFSDNNINEDNAVGTLVPAVGQLSPNSTNTFSVSSPSNATASLTQGKSSCIDTSQLLDDPNMPELEDITYFYDEDDVGAETDFNNLETSITVSHIPIRRVHKDHPVTQIIGDLSSAIQTRSMTRVAKDQGKVWVLVDLLHGKRDIGTKWVFRNKKDERGIAVRNKARLVAQGHTQEEGINYEEVFALVNAFLYEPIEEEVYVCQPSGFEDPGYLDKVYKVVKALYGLHQAPRACQDKYVAEILRKFCLIDGKSASTPIDTEKPLLKDLDCEDVDVHTYRSMIGSLM